MKDLPLIEVEELPACQWTASLERAIKTPAKFERLWGDMHKSGHGGGGASLRCIVYEPVTVDSN
jgi:hypothetical protein